jgi:hypothetical protein
VTDEDYRFLCGSIRALAGQLDTLTGHVGSLTAAAQGLAAHPTRAAFYEGIGADLLELSKSTLGLIDTLQERASGAPDSSEAP